jgi:hypothetical protein
LKDAYYNVEFALQSGEAELPTVGTVKMKGTGQKLELGAQTDTPKYGHFGVRALYADGSGDKASTPNIDEAFRPTFSKRWDGLQRTGYGALMGATLSDVYNQNAPFDANTTGLPPGGYSGIKTIGLGLFTVRNVLWTGSLDYYVYETRSKPFGLKDLGTEWDAQLTYRYTGFVIFKLGLSYFFPGQIYGGNAARVTYTTAGAHVHF